MYSANADPSETSATSRRITFEKAAATPTQGRPRIRWPYLAIPAAVLVVVVGLWLVLRGDGDEADARDDPAPTAPDAADPDPTDPDPTDPDPVEPDPAVSVADVVGKPVAEAQAYSWASSWMSSSKRYENGTPGTSSHRSPPRVPPRFPAAR